MTCSTLIVKAVELVRDRRLALVVAYVGSRVVDGPVADRTGVTSGPAVLRAERWLQQEI